MRTRPNGLLQPPSGAASGEGFAQALNISIASRTWTCVVCR